jgi:hypothetical protein
MTYEDLLNRGLIKPFTASPAQAASRLALARREIKVEEARQAFAFAVRFVKEVGQLLER